MAFNKSHEYKLDILNNGVVQVRTTTIIDEDGIEVGRRHSREVLVPGQDVTDKTEEIQAVCEAVWTPAKIDAYASSIVEDTV